MRILFLTNKPPFPPRDGSSLATAQMITGLAGRGHEVHVFFLNTSKHTAGSGDIPRTLQNISFTSFAVNTRIRYLPALGSLLFSSTPYTVSRFINRNSRQVLKRLLQETRFDIVQAEGLAMIPYCRLLPSSPDTRIVFRPHNAEYMIWQKMAGAEKNPIKKIYFHLLARQIRRYEKKAAGLFRAILPISRDDHILFHTWNPRARIMTAPFGVDVRERPQHTPPGPPALLFLGALDWQPNIRGLSWFLTEAWPLLKDKIPDLKIRIAGRNPDKNLEHFLRKITPRAGKDTGIEFLGEIGDTDDFFLSGSVFIVPLLAGGGIRIKILEAMAHGLAIVSTATGAAGIPVTHGKEILLANTPEEFAAAVEDLINDRHLSRKITGNALLLLRKEFDRKIIIENLEKFYRSL